MDSIQAFVYRLSHCFGTQFSHSVILWTGPVGTYLLHLCGNRVELRNLPTKFSTDHREWAGHTSLTLDALVIAVEEVTRNLALSGELLLFICFSRKKTSPQKKPSKQQFCLKSERAWGECVVVVMVVMDNL